MSHVITRQSLYELVWSQPMQHLAKKFSISDRGLAKVCAAANVPVPARGYWAKLQAGRPAEKSPLPERGLGQSDDIRFGQDRWSNDGETDARIMREPIPPAPVFAPDMDVVRSRVAALVKKAPLPLGDSHGWSAQIARLLDADEERRRKQTASPYALSWDLPIFDTAFEKRRLRILNALFICLARCEMGPSVSGKYGRDLSVTVGDTNMPFTLDSVRAAKLDERERYGQGFITRDDKDRMRLSFNSRWSGDTSGPAWEDKPSLRLERQLREIVAAIIVLGEQRLRDRAASAHARLIERKAELLAAERQRLAEAERRRRERRAKAEKARVDLLVGQAGALEQARQIRAYVEAVQNRNAEAPEPMPTAELEAWSTWALAQADRIDPVLSGAFKATPLEEE